jgi:hypothetical protein
MIAHVTALFTQYPWLSAALLWVFAAFIHTMPPPTPAQQWYGWLYNFLQTLGANISMIGLKSPPKP